MRCIEIKFNGPIETQQDWLTLTWDVLKYGNRKEGTVTITD